MYWEIKIITLNVAGMTNPTKRWRLLIKEHINVICLQETNLWDAEMKYL